MNTKKGTARPGHGQAGAKKTGDIVQSVLDYTPHSADCQILDHCLAKANYHRGLYIATGDANDFRLALAYQQDRETLLREHLTNRIAREVGS